MLKIFIPIILLAFNGLQFGQSVRVLRTEKLSISDTEEVFYPRFSKDDKKVIFSSSNFKGLFSYEIEAKNYSVISTKNGAGYNPLIADNDKILFRTFELKKGKKYHSINSFSNTLNKNEILEEDKRFLKLPHQISSQGIYFLENSKPIKKKIEKISVSKSVDINRAVYVEDNNLFLVDGDETKIINPLGEGTYVWESLSTDGNNILFTFGNMGTYVCDLNGEILLNIKKAHYPKFSPNGKFISYMIDEDNGTNYTSSDIFIYSLDGKNSYSVTATSDKIEMYAEWSNSGDKLVYHSTDGEIFVSTLQIQN